MAQEDLLDVMRQTDELDAESTETVAEAVLATVGERVTEGGAEELAAELPDPPASALEEGGAGEAEQFDLDEFLSRVADRMDADEETALTAARATVSVLADAAAPREFDAAFSQLPKEYDTLREPAGTDSPSPPVAAPVERVSVRPRPLFFRRDPTPTARQIR